MAQAVTKDSIERTISGALETVGADPDLIRSDARLQMLDVDSLDLVEVAQVVEDEYGVEVRGEDARRFETVGDAIEFVAARVL